MKFLFESTASAGYVGVLADSALVTGPIASQNAGSTNPGIYYQVGGGGLNQRFEQALGSLVAPVNRQLASAYDARFGAGAWQADSDAARDDRLTSLYIPLPAIRPADATVGAQVAGMVYSVGPKLQGRIVDHAAYARIYTDALLALAAVNRGAATRIAALRITMLSTGIYGGTTTDDEATALARDAASLILEAVDIALKDPSASDLPGVILVNASGADAARSKEIDAFGYAASRRGIKLDRAGFDLSL